MSYYLLFFLSSKVTTAGSQITLSDKIQILIALATLGAVIVAVFQEKIKEWFRKAHLSVVINATPPDSHKIQLITGQTDRGIVIYDEVIYSRIKVAHLKGDAAQNVEVMLVKLWEYKNGQRSLKKNFIPLNLTWANRQQKEDRIKVPAGLFRYCDLGYLQRKGQNTRFHFDTIVQPNGIGDEGDFPNVIGKGKYEIEIWVSGDNTKTIKKQWLLEIDGKWDDSEEVMLKKHLKFKELRE